MLLILNQGIKLERAIIQTCSRPRGAFRKFLQPCRLVKVRNRIKLQVVLGRSNNLEREIIKLLQFGLVKINQHDDNTQLGLGRFDCGQLLFLFDLQPLPPTQPCQSYKSSI